jgi:hypothetical protein
MAAKKKAPKRVTAKGATKKPTTRQTIANRLKRSGQAVGRNNTQAEQKAMNRQIAQLSGAKMNTREKAGRSSQG